MANDLTRAQFLARFADRRIDLEDPAARRALEGVRTGRVDENGDGRIEGPEEMSALFDELDRFDRNGDRDSVRESGRVSTLLDGVQRFARPSGASGAAPVRGADVGARMAEGGAESMRARTEAHRESIDETGIGLYYGDQSSYKASSAEERRAWLEQNRVAGAEAPSPRESSCIGWAMEHVGAAYRAAGKDARWREIERHVYRNGSKGTDLAKELEKDGWDAIYFNRDTSLTHDGGEHSYTAAMTAKGEPYYGLDVAGRITNYNASGDREDASGPSKLDDIPFYFGVAQGGQHTFVGGGGDINEFHWTAQPNDRLAIEQRPLEAFPWTSGALMVPPGSWTE